MTRVPRAQVRGAGAGTPRRGPAASFELPVPGDYVLARDACSYGYFVLEPNHWDPFTRTFRRVLDLEGGPVRLAIRQGPPVEADAPPAWRELRGVRGVRLTVTADRALGAAERAAASALLTRMLRLDEPAASVRAFHRADPRWRRLGRGRMMRSPTLFEDIIKTVTSCNVTWPSTVAMNRKLCDAAGRGGAFPAPERLAAFRPAVLRSRCGVGYRDARIVELARLFASGELDAPWFEAPERTDEELRARLLDLPGIGPYAAHNILQLLGRYGHLPLDTESVRHGKLVLGLSGTPRHVMKAVQSHFEPFGANRFRSYWLEMWTYYESKHGPSWTWQRERTATAFTAAKLKNA